MMCSEMLVYRLIEKTLEKKVYEYIPEGNMRPGQVAFHADGELEIIKDSEDDIKGYYRGHAFSGIDIERENGVVAWC